MNKIRNSLDHALEVVGEHVRKSSDDSGKLLTTNPELLKRKVAHVFNAALTRADYSYDPSSGELIFAIPTHIGVQPLEKMSDGRPAGVHIREHFEEEGWDDVTVMPARIGVDRTSIKLRSSRMTAMAFLTKTKASSGKKG